MNIFVLAAVFGLLLPLLCLIWGWSRPALRKILLAFLILELLQIVSERLLAGAGLRYVIKYSALFFVSLRIFQLFWIGRRRGLFLTPEKEFRRLCVATFFLNAVLWIFVWFRLAERILLAWKS